MKKLSFIGSVLLFAMVVTFLSIGCQKESAVNEETATGLNSSDGETIKATEAGSNSVIGLISKDHADKMAAAFSKKHPTVVTASVGYSTKNLIAYLTNMLVKQKADSVFVSFGLYDRNTAPKSSYIGRSTMFFVGKTKSSTKAGNIRNAGPSDDGDDDEGGTYLNGGQLIP